MTVIVLMTSETAQAPERFRRSLGERQALHALAVDGPGCQLARSERGSNTACLPRARSTRRRYATGAAARRVRVEDGELVAVIFEEPRLGIDLQFEAVRARSPVAPGKNRSATSSRRAISPQASLGAPPRRARRAPSAPRPGSPPEAVFHRRADLPDRTRPEVGREVLPAAVGEDGDDDRPRPAPRRSGGRRGRPRPRRRRRRSPRARAGDAGP